ncbi:hypothetical protein SDJN02_22519, partial [Cucurbita argyrosperma subsp. argyrosperma]
MEINALFARIGLKDMGNRFLRRGPIPIILPHPLPSLIRSLCQEGKKGRKTCRRLSLPYYRTSPPAIPPISALSFMPNAGGGGVLFRMVPDLFEREVQSRCLNPIFSAFLHVNSNGSFTVQFCFRILLAFNELS